MNIIIHNAYSPVEIKKGDFMNFGKDGSYQSKGSYVIWEQEEYGKKFTIKEMFFKYTPKRRRENK